MLSTTRTIGPLHFEDLEPKRFEDLVRQLIYDFRPWRALEATGRSGSDEGFDARGFENVGRLDLRQYIEEESPGEQQGDDPSNDRVWLIQCKREKSITPSKLRQHLSELPASSLVNLYGMIFVAACEFSKQTRDDFAAWRSAQGLTEAFLWGKAELEDQLYQPKNDGLLFGYFGFSLRIRKLSIRTDVRARLAMKRKCIRVLSNSYANVLVRDPTDDRYPICTVEEQSVDPRRWKIGRYLGRHRLGLMIELYSQYAFLADDQKSWDKVDHIKNSVLRYQDEWISDQNSETDDILFQSVVRFWDKLPDKNRANFLCIFVIPFESIIDIDESTDEVFDGPTIFTDRDVDFERRYWIENLETYTRLRVLAEPELRVKYFPDVYPENESSNE